MHLDCQLFSLGFRERPHAADKDTDCPQHGQFLTSAGTYHLDQWLSLNSHCLCLKVHLLPRLTTSNIEYFPLRSVVLHLCLQLGSFGFG